MRTEDPSRPEAGAALREYLQRIIDGHVPIGGGRPDASEVAGRADGVSGGQSATRATRGSAVDPRQATDEGPESLGVFCPSQGEFVPLAPNSLPELRIRSTDVEALILKFLLNCGTSTGLDIAKQIRLPLALIAGLLRQLKEERLLVYKAAAPAGDYLYELTESGHERARRCWEQCTYFGAAPVALRDYVASVHAQSIRKQNPKIADLRRALKDLVIDPEMLVQLAQAANSGQGLFLYGPAGNGKTSIARRITGAFGQAVWIPRAISVAGSVMRLYDPNNHEPLPLDDDRLSHCGRIDERWIRIRRPTIVVGGELTMENLEVRVNPTTAVSEAPVQLKSNCGTLAIDDFGRQRIRPDELLNRWILPLEKHFDILNMPNGNKIHVPFDQLLIFSTNLEPRDLVDEAFLRRIPYKVDVKNPPVDDFRNLLEHHARALGICYHDAPVDYLIEKYFAAAEREMRYCHPRDLMQQIYTYCTVLDLPMEITNEAIDAAARNYFAVL